MNIYYTVMCMGNTAQVDYINLINIGYNILFTLHGLVTLNNYPVRYIFVFIEDSQLFFITARGLVKFD